MRSQSACNGNYSVLLHYIKLLLHMRKVPITQVSIHIDLCNIRLPYEGILVFCTGDLEI